MGYNTTIAPLLVLNATNFKDYPLGGALGTVRLFLKNTRFKPILVGITNDLNQKLGKWTEIDVHGRKLPFLPVANTQINGIPHKILLMMGILIHHRKIKSRIQGSTVNIMLFVNREAYVSAKAIFGGAKQLNIFFKMTEAGNPLEISERKIGNNRILQYIYLHFFIKPMLKAAKVIFSINEECRQFCEQYLHSSVERRKIKDVHHYIEYEKIRSCYETAIVEKKYHIKRMIFWGRIADVKGIDLIIQAIDILKEENLDVHFIVIGDGSERPALEKLVVELDLQKEIVFTGRCSIEQIAVYAKNSDVFVMGSHTEGIPTSMLEAMTFGLPTVSTAVGGIPTLIKDGVNGFLVHERDPEKFSESIKRALKMDLGEVKGYNAKFIKDGYSVESVVEQMDGFMASQM
ncbi:MAG: hypothetical protein CSA23_04270 [Deltaproteobacteria bacterium]|nr:MAG: hypothetical protein CSA23_04270 [Deltaproteobacteria bacterium]